MGIKGYLLNINSVSCKNQLMVSSIYGEIGPGERIALSKLAIEKYEGCDRPFRVAIDISIWQFQIQAGQGGSNPAIRTFYYRLLRLLSVSVQPLFVFDGPNKPPFKRNKRSGHHGASIPNMMCKQLLKLFGFPFHTAPGEAEAECAYLQRKGVVDAVLSEDVDTLMFGCEVTLRNWSSEGTKGNKSPTHVSLYNAETTKRKAGLDREGMVLIALMSGGDYITEGIPGCGIKVACEAARAGFGKTLCKIPRADTAGMDEWRKTLAYELHTNESKFFRVKHKTLTIPENFPNKEVLGYYTHPVVSSAQKLDKVNEDIAWDGEINIPGLRVFVAEAFGWTHKIGARKFIRGLAPVLLVHKLRLRGDRRSSGYGDVILTAMNEMELVRTICGKRVHFSNDGIPELRVIYHPNDIVGLDLDAEEDDSEDYSRDGLAPINDDDQIEAYVSEDEGSRSASPTKRATSVYDPTQPDKLWILETIAKVGIPLKVEDYEESLRNPMKSLKAKVVAKKAATKGGMPKGAMDKFVKFSKSSMLIAESPRSPKSPKKTTIASSQPILPPVHLAPAIESFTSSQPASTAIKSSRTRYSARTSNEGKIPAPKASTKTKKQSQAASDKPRPNVNPWTIARSSPSSSAGPTITKPITRYNGASDLSPSRQTKYHAMELSSSPLVITSTVPPSRKHSQSPQAEFIPPEIPSSTPNHNPSTFSQSPLTSSSSSTSGLSPRKKRSPLSTIPSPTQVKANFSTPEPADRKIDVLSASHARSSSPALPALEDFDPPSHPSEDVISISSSPEVLQSVRINMWPRKRSPEKRVARVNDESERKDPVRDKKKYIMLRESLPGGWKEADEELADNPVGKGKRGGGMRWRMSQVGVLDLTEDLEV